MSSYVDLTAADGFVFPAYVAQPAGKPKGAVVVVQEIFGVNSHIRSVADGYAADGYLAVAPDMFHRLQPGVNLGYTPDDIQAGVALKAAAEALGVPTLMQSLQAAVDYAHQAGKVGMVGYCWGGLLTWRAASLVDGLDAAVTYYGGGMTVAAEVARKPRAPVLSHFGERDHSIVLDSVTNFGLAHPEVDARLYPADHGFNCDQRGAYDGPSAALARERSLAFFAQHLA
ncbi:carboxymethylenebutenolidase [Rhodoferax sp. OV413]|uniref:dienelactone hydrolase family protein n=1 Tax=Rhodoferax sp. OV413 TaxID=1855285 RepID=UPI0008886965|nr:dienelactone hydrolase family protein [Rhodoferax sp. OV413]SDP89661.1 carboxymethylenebutenolidase [Rhodoferax sp. OV413]